MSHQSQDPQKSHQSQENVQDFSGTHDAFSLAISMWRKACILAAIQTRQPNWDGSVQLVPPKNECEWHNAVGNIFRESLITEKFQTFTMTRYSNYLLASLYQIEGLLFNWAKTREQYIRFFGTVDYVLHKLIDCQENKLTGKEQEYFKLLPRTNVPRVVFEGNSNDPLSQRRFHIVQPGNPHVQEGPRLPTQEQSQPHILDQIQPPVPEQIQPQTPEQLEPQMPEQIGPQIPVQTGPHTPEQMQQKTPDQNQPQTTEHQHESESESDSEGSDLQRKTCTSEVSPCDSDCEHELESDSESELEFETESEPTPEPSSEANLTPYSGFQREPNVSKSSPDFFGPIQPPSTELLPVSHADSSGETLPPPHNFQTEPQTPMSTPDFERAQLTAFVARLDSHRRMRTPSPIPDLHHVLSMSPEDLQREPLTQLRPPSAFQTEPPTYLSTPAASMPPESPPVLERESGIPSEPPPPYRPRISPAINTFLPPFRGPQTPIGICTISTFSGGSTLLPPFRVSHTVSQTSAVSEANRSLPPFSGTQLGAPTFQEANITPPLRGPRPPTGISSYREARISPQIFRRPQAPSAPVWNLSLYGNPNRAGISAPQNREARMPPPLFGGLGTPPESPPPNEANITPPVFQRGPAVTFDTYFRTD